MTGENHELTPLTEMQKFVMAFMKTRKEQKGELADKRMLSVYTQMTRFNQLRTYIGIEFTGASLMTKSEMFDFMLYLLENYLAGTYKNYETFDTYYARMLALKKVGGE